MPESNRIPILKYWLRLKIVAGLARLWHQCGGSTTPFQRWARIGPEAMIGQIATIPPAIPEHNAKPLNIVFFTMLGSHSYMLASEVALARALRTRGHKVRVVLCDQALPVCENKGANNRGRWDVACFKCSRNGADHLRASRLDHDFVSALARAAEDSEATAFLDGLDFRYTIESSLYKFFRIGRLRQTEEERAIAAALTRACRLSAQAALAVARRRPDRVVMSHGVYSTWAPALAVFNQFQIPVAVYNKGKRRNSTVMNWVRGVMDWDVSGEWAKVKDLPLTRKQDQRIRTYLDSRVTHAADALKYNFAERETLDQTYARLRLDAGKQTFVLFTNVLWDAACAQKEIAFPNAVDWVMETIEWFSRHPEKQLVVKIHPAEVVIGTNQPFADEIRARFRELPSNVRLIKPHEQVNSWSIMRVATAGLVHTSTPGMELPLEGIPCVVVSGVHYRGKGFTVDIDSKEEYFRLIESWDPAQTDLERIKTLSLRYAHLLFERYHLPWDFLLEPRFSVNTAYNFSSDEELSRHPTVQTVCRAIEEKGDFLLP